MYGIDHFTAIINPPQSAILAVGAATPSAVVRDGHLTVGTTMTLTLSIDYRIIDGATGAQFLADLTTLLEPPPRIAQQPIGIRQTQQTFPGHTGGAE